MLQSHQQHEIVLRTGDRNGKVLMLPVITMKERELLLTMRGVISGIDVECQRCRCPAHSGQQTGVPGTCSS